MNSLLVALGGAIGAVARYVLDTLTLSIAAKPDFPLGMFFVNVSGAFLIGIAFGLSQKQILSNKAWSFLVVGILGAYTTFSDFTLKTLELYTNAAYGEVLLNLLCGPLGIVAVFLGLASVRGFQGVKDMF